MSKKSQMKVNDLIPLWLNNLEVSVKPSTFSTYQVILKNHIIGTIGKLKIEELNKQAIDQFIIQQYNNGRADGAGGLSAKTILNISTILTSILKFAYENKYVQFYPFSPVKPRQDMREIEILTQTEQRHLEEYIYNHLDYKIVGILLCLYSGIRIGELCALRVNDIDLENGILKINKSMQRIKNIDQNSGNKTKIIIDTPKSGKPRYIPLPTAIVDILISLYKESSPDCYILSGNHRYIEPRSYTNIFKKCLKECNIREINFHALRHTFATRCIEAEFDIKTLSEILGHSDVRITLSTYVHSSYHLKCKYMKSLKLMCG